MIFQLIWRLISENRWPTFTRSRLNFFSRGTRICLINLLCKHVPPRFFWKWYWTTNKKKKQKKILGRGFMVRKVDERGFRELSHDRFFFLRIFCVGREFFVHLRAARLHRCVFYRVSNEFPGRRGDFKLSVEGALHARTIRDRGRQQIRPCEKSNDHGQR